MSNNQNKTLITAITEAVSFTINNSKGAKSGGVKIGSIDRDIPIIKIKPLSI